MKRFFLILVLLLLTAEPLLKIGTIIHYQFNIETIIEKFCINKEKPELKCNGKCYLMSKLDSSSKAKKSESFTSNKTLFFLFYFKEKLTKINLFCFNNVSIIQNWNNDPFIYSSYLVDLEPPPPKKKSIISFNTKVII